MRVVKPGDKQPKIKTKDIVNLNKFNIDEVDKILLAHLANYPGATLKELGELINYTEGGVQKRMKRPAFQKAMERLNEKTMDILARVQRRATQRLMELVNDNDPRIALDAVRMALTPMLNKGTLEISTVKEIIHQVKFGPHGELIKDIVEIKATDEPKTTMALLE